MAQVGEVKSDWEIFKGKLKERQRTFDMLDVDTDWKGLLVELGYSALDSGVLLKEIKSRKPPSSGMEK